MFWLLALVSGIAIMVILIVDEFEEGCLKPNSEVPPTRG